MRELPFLLRRQGGNETTFSGGYTSSAYHASTRFEQDCSDLWIYFTSAFYSSLFSFKLGFHFPANHRANWEKYGYNKQIFPLHFYFVIHICNTLDHNELWQDNYTKWDANIRKKAIYQSFQSRVCHLTWHFWLFDVIL